MAWVFMLPLVIVNLLVIVGPSIATIYYSFTEWSGIGPAEFVGLQNYRQMLTSGEFYGALLHNIIWIGNLSYRPYSHGPSGGVLALADNPLPDALPSRVLYPLRHSQRSERLDLGEPLGSGASASGPRWHQ